MLGWVVKALVGRGEERRSSGAKRNGAAWYVVWCVVWCGIVWRGVLLLLLLPLPLLPVGGRRLAMV